MNVIENNTSTAPSDLLRRAADGEREAWEELTSGYAGLLHARTRQYRLQEADALDVIQTTWLRLAQNLDRIRTPEGLAGWLSTVASREALQALRKQLRGLTADDVEIGVDAPEDDVEHLVIAAEEAAEVRAAVATLPPDKQALVAELFASDPRSYAGIADRLGVPIGSIGPNRGRVLDRLRLRLRRAPAGASCA
jgi:RNA polymerase sigma factor (sigma-70 family)